MRLLKFPFFTGFLLFLLGLIYSPTCKAQVSELGISLGATTYKGELNPVMFTTNFSVYHPAVGFFFRRNTNAHWAYRFNFLRGKVSGSDANSKLPFAKTRNLSFTSPVYELAFLLEFNFFPFEKYGSDYWSTPYIFAGYSGFYFSPKSTLNGQDVKLQQQQLEGKGYSQLARAIPMGIGMKFKTGLWVFALELGARKTTTDFLDNVSGTYLNENAFTGDAATLANPSPDTSFVNLAGRQRGNSKDKDWFVFLGATASIKVGNFRKKECQRLMDNL